MGSRGHVIHLDFGDRGHAKYAMGPKQSLEGVIFGLKSRCRRGFSWHVLVLGLQCHPSGCDFWLEWFLWIHGTQGTCQRSRFGNGVHARFSMGPKRSLERVFFSLKCPCLRGGQRHVLGLQGHKCDCISICNGSYGSMGPKGHARCLDLVMGAMPGDQWVRNDRLRGSFLA